MWDAISAISHSLPLFPFGLLFAWIKKESILSIDIRILIKKKKEPAKSSFKERRTCCEQWKPGSLSMLPEDLFSMFKWLCFIQGFGDSFPFRVSLASWWQKHLWRHRRSMRTVSGASFVAATGMTLMLQSFVTSCSWAEFVHPWLNLSADAWRGCWPPAVTLENLLPPSPSLTFLTHFSQKTFKGRAPNGRSVFFYV